MPRVAAEKPEDVTAPAKPDVPEVASEVSGDSAVTEATTSEPAASVTAPAKPDVPEVASEVSGDSAVTEATTSEPAASVTAPAKPDVPEQMLAVLAFAAQHPQFGASVSASANTSAINPAEWLRWLLQNVNTAEKLIGIYREWASITTPIDTRGGLRMRAIVAIKLLKLLAENTPTKVDDDLVAMLSKLLDDSTLTAVLEDLLWKLWPRPGNVGVLADPLRVYTQEAWVATALRVEERAVRWDRLLALLPQIIEVIGWFRKSQQAE